MFSYFRRRNFLEHVAENMIAKLRTYKRSGEEKKTLGIFRNEAGDIYCPFTTNVSNGLRSMTEYLYARFAFMENPEFERRPGDYLKLVSETGRVLEVKVKADGTVEKKCLGDPGFGGEINRDTIAAFLRHAAEGKAAET